VRLKAWYGLVEVFSYQVLRAELLREARQIAATRYSEETEGKGQQFSA
jgi:hypothetical protein